MILDYTAHSWTEIPAQLSREASSYTTSKGGSKQDRYAIYNVAAALDIETSSFYDNGQKRACHVCWQIGINGKAYIGRTWSDLLEALTMLQRGLALDDTHRLAIYVHNLSYEYQWLRKVLTQHWDECFAADSREPLRARYGGIELRDSYILSGLSLGETAKTALHKYKIAKLTSWDYAKVRHEGTPLTKGEMDYAIVDVLVVMALIQEKMDQEGGVISTIPMTRTGYVRRAVRAAVRADANTSKRIKNLKLSTREYHMLKKAFAGGFTHASHNHVGKTLERVGSYDFTSSYPAVMVMEKYPMGVAGEGIPSSVQEMQTWMSTYCCIMTITLRDVRPRVGYEHIISVSKCDKIEDYQADNGRVVTAKELLITVTEIDYKMIARFYDFGSITIHHVTRYYKDYLPTPIIRALLDFYAQKTAYKGVPGREVEYMLAKEMCNSIYGMMVMDIVRDNIEYDGDWHARPGIAAEQIDHYNRSRNRFTYYPWGVYITAYARYNLLCGILAAGPAYVYADTDSVKYILSKGAAFESFTDRYAALVDNKMALAMQRHGLDPDAWRPTDCGGTRHPLGYWDREKDYYRFKTLGAKRYIGEVNGKITATIAGSSKAMAAEYLSQFPDPFKAFSNGLVFPSTHSGRMAATYIDQETSGTVTDYLGITSKYRELSSVHLEPTEYSLTMGRDFLEYLYGDVDKQI